VFACVVFARSGVAQKFQEPTKEELAMTSDPKAPGAPAVYLYREETTDNRSHYISQYARIKILTEKGREEWSNIEVPYSVAHSASPVIEARTIHSDGTVIPLVGKPADLLVSKNNRHNVNVTVFSMPSVEVGSILEYKWTVPMGAGKVSGGIDAEQSYYASALASVIPSWEVQQDLYVHKEHFYYNPRSDLESNVLGSTVTWYVDGERASYLIYMQRLPHGFKVTESPKQDYTLDITDVPAFTRVPNAPPEESFRYRVNFYYTPYTTPVDYWANESKRWSKMLDQFASPSSAVQAAATQITAGAATPEAKARKLYDAVQAMDNTDFSRRLTEEERRRGHLKAEIKKADDVLSEKSGSGNDLAGLYLALARAAGVQADGIKIASRDERIFDMNYLKLGQLDTLLVVLHLNGQDVYVDPGEKLCPFGQLHWSHTLAGGLQQNVAKPIYTPANQVKDAITAHAADLTVDASGKATGTVQLVMNGPAALHWRQLSLTHGSEEVQKQLDESLRQLLPAGVNGEISGIKGLDTAEGFLQATAKVAGQVGTVTGKRVLLPAFVFSSGAAQQFVSDPKREMPVDLRYAEQVIDDVIYRLPAGYAVESAPQQAQLPWPEHAALVVKVATTPNTVDVKHVYARAAVLVDSLEYPALHDYYSKLAENDRQQVVLTAGGTASGN
jgi:hypothetical protein